MSTCRKRSNESRFGEYKGFYSKTRRDNENYRMYWQFPGSADVQHVTLATKDPERAQDLILAFV